ncbi:P-loop containing nucleoside triphosphate hydrolase protein [Cokeromyces recurvatus]|uniref:P-loop containing nucleoside triphosphate hydrolase protein n=1 Tax=Cokeromyces recurvatus TaxID=90255 RepID=UPI00221F7688|nr:P-loop containing nucleoside triphosphate hydrolase protein [Cokeromyces recurvatus]KAI7907757.1 P-loop containing nucleoside triphosphate hydrolase protein [Cokeromyces recurvatus]
MANKFIPRTTFPYDRIINWFPGHMAKGLRLISERLNSVDLVVEVRDARIPLSSVNPNFEKLVGRRPRLIVYNKFDLANQTTKKPLLEAFSKHAPATPVVFTNCQTDSSVKEILRYATKLAHPIPQVTLMVVGVGKGKAAATGAQPGITRTVIGTIKVLEDPTIYLVDTPGVMVPYLEDPIRSLKVALTGGIRDHLSDEQIMVDYLLYRLNNFEAYNYATWFNLPNHQPTNDVNELLEGVAKRIGAIVKGGELDLNMAAKFFLKYYRTGKLGQFTLDDVSPQSLDKFFETQKMYTTSNGQTISRRQEKKAIKLEQRKKSRKENQVAE